MDAKDKIVLGLAIFIVVAAWVWVYLHPSAAAFAAAVGGTGAVGGILHFIFMKDDKLPDRKLDSGT